MKSSKDWIALILMAFLFICVFLFGKQEKRNVYFDGTIMDVSSKHLIVKATSKLDRKTFGSGNMLQVNMEELEPAENLVLHPGAQIRIFYRDIQKNKTPYPVITPIRILLTPFLYNSLAYGGPDGYHLTELYGSDAEYRIVCSNDMGDQIVYTQKLHTEAAIDPLTYGSMQETLFVEDLPITAYRKENVTHLYWEAEHWDHIVSGTADKDTLLSICTLLIE